MLSASTVCGGRKYFVDMTIKTFCRLIALFPPLLFVATSKQCERCAPEEKKPVFGCQSFWMEAGACPDASRNSFHAGCGQLGTASTSVWPNIMLL